jgi:O-antigen/teichoic acid export membrane protein
MYNGFLSGTFYNIIFKIASTILLFFITPLFISKMGEELYGIWILNFTIIGFFALVINGLPGGIIKFVSENNKDPNYLSKIISISLFTYLIIGLILGSVIFIFSEQITIVFNISEVNRPISIKLLKIASFFLAILWPLSISDSVLQGLLKFKELNIVRSLQVVANSSVILFGLYFELDLGYILAFSYSTTCICSIVMFLYVKKFINPLKISFNTYEKTLFKEIMFFSLALVGIELSALLAYQSDELIIGYFLNVKDISYYFVTTALFFNLRIIYGILTGLVLPVVFEAKKKSDYKLIDNLVFRGIRYINIVFITVVILVSVISEHFITLWMGEKFSKYSFWASLLVLQYLYNASYVSFLSRILLGFSEVKFIFYINFIFNIIKILLSIYLVSEYNIIGVFSASIINSFLSFIFLFPIISKKLNYSWFKLIKNNFNIHLFQVLLIIIGFTIINYIAISWVNLVLFCFTFLFIAYFIQYHLFFLDKEKKYVLTQIYNLKKRFFNK